MQLTKSNQPSRRQSFVRTPQTQSRQYDQEEDPFRTTYKDSFNNPQLKRKSVSKTNLVAVGKGPKQRFTSPPKHLQYEALLASPSQTPTNRLLQQRKTQHYYNSQKQKTKIPQKHHKSASSLLKYPQDDTLSNQQDYNERLGSILKVADKSKKRQDATTTHSTRQHQLHLLSQGTGSKPHNQENQKYLVKLAENRGQKRIIDRFVKYPYPSSIITNYRKDYNSNQTQFTQGELRDKEAFNLEKEHKIINPHTMDFKTTSRLDFKPFAVKPCQKYHQKQEKSSAPFAQGSQYRYEYPNWCNTEHLIEKTPQYPVYSLPFKGETVYNTAYHSQSHKSLKRPESASVMKKHPSQSQIKIMNFTPQPFNYETTKQKDFQPFKIQSRPQTSKPRTEAIQTRASPGHYVTQTKKDYVGHLDYRAPDVDYIPFP